MAVVEEGMIGNTKYKIYDDAFRNRTSEEIQGTLDHLGEMASEFYARKEVVKALKGINEGATEVS